jgi:hypothetical protein
MPNGAPLIAFRQNRAETSDAPSAPGTWLHASWPLESGHSSATRLLNLRPPDQLVMQFLK